MGLPFTTYGLYKLNCDIILIVQYEVLGGTQNVGDDGPTEEV